MTYSSTVLFVTHHSSVAELVREEVESIDGFAFQWSDDPQGVDSELIEEEIGLVVLHLDGTIDEGDVALLLWKTSTARREVPVFVISDRYDVEEALGMFRLGVADYISLPDHRDSLSSLCKTLALPTFTLQVISHEAFRRLHQGSRVVSHAL